MRVVTADQHGADWLIARAGHSTASRMNDVMAKPDSQAYQKYRTKLITERLSGRSVEQYVSPHMDFGIQTEPVARTEYEIVSGNNVNRTGFVLHPTFDFSGASPDGLVDANGCIEIKVPCTHNHIGWMEQWKKQGTAPTEHIRQCQWVINCCEREWCDFISFNAESDEVPNHFALDDKLNLFTVRVYRDDKAIAAMEERARLLNQEIEDIIGVFYEKPGALKEKLRKSVAVDEELAADIEWWRQKHGMADAL